ncbi:MAG: hypothetical protein E7467_04730 [Ruminococcaceae bacterium]|nr:hypothetical protein [Oscillospiraceae bacterium]
MNKMTRLIAIVMAILLLTACTASEKKVEETELIKESAMAGGEQDTEDVKTGDDSENIAEQSVPAESGTNGEEELQTSGGAQPSEPDNQSSEPQSENTDSGATNIHYEPYLAALSLMSLSLEYPGFELDGIYFETIVDVSEKFESKGLYICFKSGGESLIIRVLPMENERTEPMTRDIFADQVGYASFDLADTMPEGLKRMREEDFASLLPELTAIKVLMH